MLYLETASKSRIRRSSSIMYCLIFDNQYEYIMSKELVTDINVLKVQRNVWCFQSISFNLNSHKHTKIHIEENSWFSFMKIYKTKKIAKLYSREK